MVIVKRALLFCLLFLAFFTGSFYFFAETYSYPLYGSDFGHHFNMSKGVEPYETYPMFWGILASPFTFNPMAYFFFSLLLFVFVLPLFLGAYLKDWVFVLFYFSIGFVFRLVEWANFPQALISFLFIPFLLTKSFHLKFCLLFLSLFVHSFAFPLFVMAWALQLMVKFLRSRQKFVLGCFPLLGSSADLVNSINVGRFVTLGDVFRFFLREFNFVLVFLGFFGFVKKKHWDLMLVCVVMFLCGVVIYARAWQTMSLVLLVGCVWGFRSIQSRIVKKGVIFCCFVFMGYNVFVFFSDYMYRVGLC